MRPLRTVLAALIAGGSMFLLGHTVGGGSSLPERPRNFPTVAPSIPDRVAVSTLPAVRVPDLRQPPGKKVPPGGASAPEPPTSIGTREAPSIVAAGASSNQSPGSTGSPTVPTGTGGSGSDGGSEPSGRRRYGITVKE